MLKRLLLPLPLPCLALLAALQVLAPGCTRSAVIEERALPVPTSRPATTRSASREPLRELPFGEEAAPKKLLASSPQPVMVIHCIDVGQADATLLEFPCGVILIDAGAQDDDAVAYLLNYLERFFMGRPDLNRTIEAVVVTHNHIDHTRALKEVVERFVVRRYIDNGQITGRGTEDPRWVRANAQTDGRNVAVTEIGQDQIAALLPARAGLTGPGIDPLSCDLCDPRILILSARYDDNPGWPEGDFDNKNVHSLVVRVDFGAASALFTGDLESSGIQTLLEAYAGTPMLDVDLWHVGHHGSHNATTAALLDVLTLKAAVISVGKWDYGLN